MTDLPEEKEQLVPSKNKKSKYQGKICIEENCNEPAKRINRCNRHASLHYYYTHEKHKPLHEQGWKKSFLKRKKKVFENLGNRCEICDEVVNWKLKPLNLQLDHKYYDANLRTRYIEEIDRGRSASTRALKEAEEHPEYFQLLCRDCHVIKGFSRTCPLKLQKCAKHFSTHPS